MNKRMSLAFAVLIPLLGASAVPAPQSPARKIEGPYRAVVTDYLDPRQPKRNQRFHDLPEVAAAMNELWRQGYEPTHVQALPWQDADPVRGTPGIRGVQFLIIGQVE